MTLEAFTQQAPSSSHVNSLAPPPAVGNGVVKLQVVEGSDLEPAPITPSQGKAFELMSGTIKQVFQGAIVAPSGMIG